MNMQINSISSYGGSPDPSTQDIRSRYLGALSAALRSGDIDAAQQALLGFVGSGGIISPSTLFERLERSLSTGDKTQMDQLSRDIANSQEAQHQNKVAGPNNPHSSANPGNPTVDHTDHALLVGASLGSLINTSA
ncbi:hypothetical protein [Polynucleobacter sp. UK-Mo-2m-Kol15]|uniref:hypothetical protein n=1 Tax=Polynucleobacter sp. UK-Mo-2m-Kol15 TaxID=2576916 RepID=UPI001C0CF094|nr:hypothetical protein [Polynucleobacter sp. UK-Mo-2m-Kol15]MBU3575951.1 hypothetical protein [Polynucleobacter sp. UK-Mo-2m-Kol15]